MFPRQSRRFTAAREINSKLREENLRLLLWANMARRIQFDMKPIIVKNARKAALVTRSLRPVSSSSVEKVFPSVVGEGIGILEVVVVNEALVISSSVAVKISVVISVVSHCPVTMELSIPTAWSAVSVSDAKSYADAILSFQPWRSCPCTPESVRFILRLCQTYANISREITSFPIKRTY